MDSRINSPRIYTPPLHILRSPKNPPPTPQHSCIPAAPGDQQCWHGHVEEEPDFRDLNNIDESSEETDPQNTVKSSEEELMFNMD